MADREARRRERRWPIPYLDLSNTLFFFFVALFAIALLAISDADERRKVDTSSKLLVTLTWRDGSANDVDLSVKVPNDEVVWFRKRQAAFASLDHDNLGMGNSAVVDGDGNPVTAPGRDEVVYIRQTVPGTYVVTASLDVLAMLDQLVAERLLHVRRALAQPRNAIDHVHREMKSIEIV